ncbi:MAG: (2Fe-2S)-binding protein [Deltaproteobacteria bacterium]|nr:(2Fe-2S)-binding protein [Deltaproteobacteria bacterium]
MKIPLTITVNGERYDLEIKPNRTLLDLLREDLGLTGTKKGCGLGECGSCTVLLDGEPVKSCLILALQANGKEVLTIEGLGKGKPDPLQIAFVEKGAVQCGFCTPGMIMTAKALLNKNPQPNDLEIKEAIAGNLCRCTGYNKIVEAIKSCAASTKR